MTFRVPLFALLTIFLATCYSQTTESTGLTGLCSCEEVIKTRCELQSVKKELQALKDLADSLPDPSHTESVVTEESEPILHNSTTTETHTTTELEPAPAESSNTTEPDHTTTTNTTHTSTNHTVTSDPSQSTTTETITTTDPTTNTTETLEDGSTHITTSNGTTTTTITDPEGTNGTHVETTETHTTTTDETITTGNITETESAATGHKENIVSTETEPLFTTNTEIISVDNTGSGHTLPYGSMHSEITESDPVLTVLGTDQEVTTDEVVDGDNIITTTTTKDITHMQSVVTVTETKVTTFHYADHDQVKTDVTTHDVIETYDLVHTHVETSHSPVGGPATDPTTESTTPETTEQGHTTTTDNTTVTVDNTGGPTEVTYPWTETSTEHVESEPVITVEGTDQEVVTEESIDGDIKTITTTTRDISHMKSVVIAQDITTTITHYEDRDEFNTQTTSYEIVKVWDDVITTTNVATVNIGPDGSGKVNFQVVEDGHTTTTTTESIPVDNSGKSATYPYPEHDTAHLESDPVITVEGTDEDVSVSEVDNGDGTKTITTTTTQYKHIRADIAAQDIDTTIQHYLDHDEVTTATTSYNKVERWDEVTTTVATDTVII